MESRQFIFRVIPLTLVLGFALSRSLKTVVNMFVKTNYTSLALRRRTQLYAVHTTQEEERNLTTII